MSTNSFTRRAFLALSAMLPFAWSTRAFGKKSSIPIGLEMYSVRDPLKQDAQGTVRGVAQMGYQGLEFYAPYYQWTDAQAKDMRKLLDDLGIRCFSTHNEVGLPEAGQDCAHARHQRNSRKQVCSTWQACPRFQTSTAGSKWPIC